MKKMILDKIAELNKKNKALFDRKAKLESEILAIDIKIFKISGEYDKLAKKLLNE